MYNTCLKDEGENKDAIESVGALGHHVSHVPQLLQGLEIEHNTKSGEDDDELKSLVLSNTYTVRVGEEVEDSRI